MPRIIAVANQKGGVAKTTTVHALGAASAQQGQRVLLVDLDPQACLTFSAGVEPDALHVSLHDVLLERVPARDVLLKLDTFSLLPATIDLAGSELHLLGRTGREYVLRRALMPLLEEYDVVVIDCPPSLGILTINGLTAAREVLIPLQCETLSRRGVAQLLETIDDVRAYTNESLQVLGAIATMHDARTKLAGDVIETVRAEHGIVVFDPPVPKSVRAAEAPNHGRSVVEHAPQSRPALAYVALAASLLAP
jgi:chromosome partitioning protein